MSEEHQLVTRQKAFVLLQVFLGKEHKLPQSKLSEKFTKPILQKFGADKSAIEAVRDALIQGGYLYKSMEGKKGKMAYLQLTEKGRALLLNSPQYHSLDLTITGEGLTSLMKELEEVLLGQKGTATNGVNLVVAQAQLETIFAETLRGCQNLFASAQTQLTAVFKSNPIPTGAGPQATPPEAKLDAARPEPRQEAPPLPSDEEFDLNGEILAAFEYLKQEKYIQGEMVPIHAIRHRIAERLGEEAASHAVFDPAIQRLSGLHKIRLVSISDQHNVTEAEINASIPGVNEIFFYLKAIHEHVLA